MIKFINLYLFRLNFDNKSIEQYLNQRKTKIYIKYALIKDNNHLNSYSKVI